MPLLGCLMSAPGTHVWTCLACDTSLMLLHKLPHQSAAFELATADPRQGICAGEKACEPAHERML